MSTAVTVVPARTRGLPKSSVLVPRRPGMDQILLKRDLFLYLSISLFIFKILLHLLYK